MSHWKTEKLSKIKGLRSFHWTILTLYNSIFNPWRRRKSFFGPNLVYLLIPVFFAGLKSISKIFS